MGYVKEQIAEPHLTVEGAIIALDDDRKLCWALLAVLNISFYRYQVSSKLLLHCVSTCHAATRSPNHWLDY